MRVHYQLGYLACLAVCFLLSGSDLLVAGGGETPSPALVILSTGNTSGIFEPCRCPTNPYGGVARRVTLISDYRTKAPSLLLVDSGNVFDSDLSAARTKSQPSYSSAALCGSEVRIPHCGPRHHGFVGALAAVAFATGPMYCVATTTSSKVHRCTGCSGVLSCT